MYRLQYIKTRVNKEVALVDLDFLSVCRSGLRVPIACSLLGGGVPIPEQRLCWTLDSVPYYI